MCEPTKRARVRSCFIAAPSSWPALT
jgi:hypothetical protein